MRTTIKTQGDDAAGRRLDHAAVRAQNQSHAMNVAARDTAIATSRQVPVRSGALARDVRGSYRADQRGFVVRSTVPYGPYVFEGTRHMKARPVTVPRNTGPHTAQLINDDLGSALR